MKNNNRSQSVRNKAKRSRNNSRKQYQVVHLRDAGRFCPDILYTTLRFSDQTLARSATGTSNAMNWGYRSSAFDPDPALLTGAIPGFVELANMFEQYRVHSMIASVTIINQETEGLIVTIWPAQLVQNVNSLNTSDIIEYGSNVGGKSIAIGPVQSLAFKTVGCKASGMDLIGPTFKYDLDFASTTSGNPVNSFAINVGIAKTQGNFNFPVGSRVVIRYMIEFFQRRQLES